MPTPSSPQRGLIEPSLRPAGIDHWSDIRSLHSLAFRRLSGPSLEAAEARAFLAQIYEPDYTDVLQTQDIITAWHEDRLIATAGWVPSNDAGSLARITAVFVSPLYVRQGVGRLVVLAAEERARKAGFRSFAARSFPSCTGFFEALGYSRSSQGVQAIGREHGVPVVFMRKETAAKPAADDDRAQLSSPGPTANP